MPLLLSRKAAYNTKIAVWKASEEISFFLQALDLSEAEEKKFSEMRPHRQREWLSSRYLLHWLGRDYLRVKIGKEFSGKPYRIGCHKHISISHSQDVVAAVISDRVVGIDVQVPNDKIVRIQHKFVSPSEHARLPKKNLIDYYHVFWGAKESMYKAYGQKELGFITHMHLFPFRIEQGITELRGRIKKEQLIQKYHLEMERVEGAFLVVCALDDDQI